MNTTMTLKHLHDISLFVRGVARLLGIRQRSREVIFRTPSSAR